MIKKLYILLLPLFVILSACSDDKEDDKEIDTFDYNVLDEELNGQCLKIYDGDTVLETKEMLLGHFIPLGINETFQTLDLRTELNNKYFMMYWWHDDRNLLQEIENGRDTFALVTKYNEKYAKKGIIVIKNLKYNSADSYNPPAVSDSIFIEAAFNIQVESDNTERMIKGVFYYRGKLEPMI